MSDSKREENRKKWLSRLHQQMQRPNQGPAEGPYWIVLNLSQHKNLNSQPPHFPFRHATLESAMKEAGRLSTQPHMVGWRFGVFRYTGASVKSENADSEEREIAAAVAEQRYADQMAED